VWRLEGIRHKSHSIFGKSGLFRCFAHKQTTYLRIGADAGAAASEATKEGKNIIDLAHRDDLIKAHWAKVPETLKEDFRRNALDHGDIVFKELEGKKRILSKKPKTKYALLPSYEIYTELIEYALESHPDNDPYTPFNFDQAEKKIGQRRAQWIDYAKERMFEKGTSGLPYDKADCESIKDIGKDLFGELYFTTNGKGEVVLKAGILILADAIFKQFELDEIKKKYSGRVEEVRRLKAKRYKRVIQFKNDNTVEADEPYLPPDKALEKREKIKRQKRLEALAQEQGPDIRRALMSSFDNVFSVCHKKDAIRLFLEDLPDINFFGFVNLYNTTDKRLSEEARYTVHAELCKPCGGCVLKKHTEFAKKMRQVYIKKVECVDALMREFKDAQGESYGK
jgi:hypothetical protein